MISKTIGLIGLGKMGTPMAANLVKAGYDVTVYNRSRKAAIEKVVDTPAALIQQTEVVIVMVSDDQAIRDVFEGDNGLLSAGVQGKIVINMSTVSPAISKEMAALLQKQGNHYLDAPVSGSVKQAEDGQLVIMVGGDKAIFEQVEEILGKLGKMSLYLGDTGMGNTAKLAINTLLGLQSQALAETLSFASKKGIALQDMLTIINNGAMASVYAKLKGDMVMNHKYDAAFALKHIAKDLRLAKAEGLDSPLANVTHDTFQAALPALGEKDIIAIAQYIDPKL
jgi:3-hydroxyisobutyrate dehydrogenase